MIQIFKSKVKTDKIIDINWMWIAFAHAVSLLGVGVPIVLRRGVANRKWKDQFARFGDSGRIVEMCNSAYFHSLEQMLKNLEFVRGCTTLMERKPTARKIVAERTS